MNDAMRVFLREHNIHEVECVIPDMTGIARGKILPKDLFLNGEHMRLPKSVLLNTVNGEQPNNLPYVGATDLDMVCVPDAATIRVVPWASEAVALVIHDCRNFDGSPVELAPRSVLQRVLDLYAQRGWKPLQPRDQLVGAGTFDVAGVIAAIHSRGIDHLYRIAYNISIVNNGQITAVTYTQKGYWKHEHPNFQRGTRQLEDGDGRRMQRPRANGRDPGERRTRCDVVACRFNSMEETMYLLSSPKNASRLMQSIAQLKAGKAQIRELLRNEQEGAKQEGS